MPEIFRNWISLILSFGILLTIIKLIIPKSNLKKYIYSLIGIVTIIVIVSPVLKYIRNENIDGLKDVVLNIANMDVLNSKGSTNLNISKYKEIGDNNVKNSFKTSIENDVKNKLKDKTGKDIDVTIDINSEYNIERINITLHEELENNFNISEYLNNEYDIDKSSIIITKEIH